MKSSELVNDLRQIPNIIGALGLAIAESQKHFDEEYLRGIERLAKLARTYGTSDEVLRHLVSVAAPPRYQFTQTDIAVRLDLAQSRSTAAQGGLGFGFAGVVVSAGYAASTASDYRAAAEVRLTLHAAFPTENAFASLLDRVKDLPPTELPTLRPADENVHQALQAAIKALT